MRAGQLWSIAGISINRISRLQLRIASVFAEYPSVPAVSKKNIQNLPKFLFRIESEYRRDYLNTFGKIAEHPVSGPDEEITVKWVVVARGKMENAGMFKKAA